MASLGILMVAAACVTCFAVLTLLWRAAC